MLYWRQSNDMLNPKETREIVFKSLITCYFSKVRRTQGRLPLEMEYYNASTASVNMQ